MVYRPEIDKRLCFVLLPLREPFLGYYEHIIKPAAADSGLDALKSDEIYGTRPIIHDIWDSIWRARVVIADVTERNPNVNYELGLCHALGVPTILVTQKMGDVPFDYRHRRCIEYNHEKAGWESRLREKLRKTIETVLSGKDAEAELVWPYNTALLTTAPTGGDLITAENTRAVVVRGAELVRDAIAVSFGPQGTHVQISTAPGLEQSTRSGLLISRGIRSSNILETKGIDAMRIVAREAYDRSGDLSKTAVLLAFSMLKHGHNAIEQGHPAKRVTSGMERAIEMAQGHLAQQAISVKAEDLQKVARTAANGSASVAALVVQAIKQAGREGIISVEESGTDENTLQFLEGMQFSRGYISEHFVNAPERQESVLEDCLVLIHERKITSMRTLLPLLEQVAKVGRSLLIVAEDVEGEALSTLVVNMLKGTISCAAVKAPGFAARRAATLEDIAAFTGGKAFTEEKGLALENATLRDLGEAKKVTVTRDSTTLLGGAGKPDAIDARAKAIRLLLGETQDDREREFLQQRLANLAGEIAIIQVGGETTLDVSTHKYEITSALHSARSAIEEGAILGGGLTLYRVGLAAKQLPRDDEAVGAGILAIATALEEPVRALIENSKRSPTQTLAEIDRTGDPQLGFDAQSGALANLHGAGIFDPVKSVRHAIIIAFSHARRILETGAWDLGAPEVKQSEM